MMKVRCSRHGRERGAKYCESVPVYNALMEEIGTEWRCRPGEECTTGQRGAAADGGAAGDGATEGDAATKLYRGPGAAGRYWDLSKPTGGAGVGTPGAGERRRCCFVCGAEGHERPDCPNMLCHNCHDPLPIGGDRRSHMCSQLRLSDLWAPLPGTTGAFDFVTEHLPPAKAAAADGGRRPGDPTATTPVTKAEMAATRCTICHQHGHMDCAGITNPPDWVPQCSYCAGRGHHAFDCDAASYRDEWAQAQRALTGASRPTGGRGGGGGGGGPRGYYGGGGAPQMMTPMVTVGGGGGGGGGGGRRLPHMPNLPGGPMMAPGGPRVHVHGGYGQYNHHSHHQSHGDGGRRRPRDDDSFGGGGGGGGGQRGRYMEPRTRGFYSS